MRGCRGSGFHIGPDPSNRVGRSGRTAREWGEFGMAMGKKKRKHLSLGYCKGCKYWGKRKLSPKYEAQFQACWGESSEKTAEKKCILTPEEFLDSCPHEEK